MYCSKCGKMPDVTPYTQSSESANSGSFAVGFILVWFVGLIGLIIAYAMKQSETWRGAKFCIKLVLISVAVVLLICAILVFASMKGAGYYY